MNDCYLNFLVSFRALFSLDVGANLVNSKQTIGIILPDLSLLGYAVPVESFGIGLFVILFAYLIIEYNVQLLSHEKFKIAMNMLHTAHTPLILLRNQLEELKTGNLPEPLSQQVEEALGYAECIIYCNRNIATLNKVNKRIPPKTSTVNLELSTYVTSIVNQCRAHANSRQIRLTVGECSDCVSCRINENIMTAALQHLINKMILISESGCCISINVTHTMNSWQLQISNNEIVNITIQNSIFSEALDTYNHAFGATIGGHNSMFCRNLFASNISRNSSVGMDGDFNFVNNVVFNWWNRSVDGGDHNSFYNMINNYFKPGPITPIGKPISYRILKPEAGRDKNRPLSFGKAYVNGNIIHGNAKVTKDNWDGGVQLKEEVDAAKFLPLIKSDEAFKMPPVTVMDTKKAYTFVLDNVGANFPKRDAVDARVIKTVQTGKAIYAKDAPEFVSPYVKRRLPADSYKQGIITDIRQVGGLPEYKGEAVVDSDGDGMPDAWETANGLNPNDPADANMDCNGDGYTNIEKYINGIDTRKKVDWTDLKNNYDTLSKRRSLL